MSEKYDLHTHLFTNWEKGKYSLERAPRTPEYVLNAVYKKGLDGITFTNFGDKGSFKSAYEALSELSKDRSQLGRYRLVRELRNALVFTDENKLLKIIKGQEIPTSEGHILGIASDKGLFIPGRASLKTTLSELNRRKIICSADHYNGFAGIGKTNLEKYREYFDTFEGKNQNYTHFLFKCFIGLNPSEEELIRLEKKLEKKWIAVSDCHNKDDLGNGFIEIRETLDFSSGDNLKEHLKDILNKGRFIPIAKNPNLLSSILAHAVIHLYDAKIRGRLGWGNFEIY